MKTLALAEARRSETQLFSSPTPLALALVMPTEARPAAPCGQPSLKWELDGASGQLVQRWIRG